MKKLLWALFSAAFAIYGCTGPVNSSVPDPISFSATTFSLDADGRAQTFTVIAPEGVWNVSTSASWLHVTPKSGTGSVKVSVSADVNHMDIDRSAAMEFTMPGYFSGVISLPVTQAAGYGEDPGPGPDPGPGGDITHAGTQYLGCYEIPAVSLKNTESPTSFGTDGSGPWYTYQTTNKDRRIVTHAFKDGNKQWRNWTALIDSTKQAPLWSAFIMHDEISPRSGSIGRGSWHPDPAVPDKWQSCFASGNYHRGHLVANGYRQGNSNARDQTFYYTNQALQEQNGFNGAIWETLENKVRSIVPLSDSGDTLYVVVGLLYEGTPRIMDGKPAPSHFYKLLMKCGFEDNGSMKSAVGVAYLMTNDAHSDRDYDKADYRTTIDAIEQRTGFDFFANVPLKLQEAAESTSSPIW